MSRKGRDAPSGTDEPRSRRPSSKRSPDRLRILRTPTFSNSSAGPVSPRLVHRADQHRPALVRHVDLALRSGDTGNPSQDGQLLRGHRWSIRPSRALSGLPVPAWPLFSRLCHPASVVRHVAPGPESSRACTRGAGSPSQNFRPGRQAGVVTAQDGSGTSKRTWSWAYC
jgi:hypothetical protein